MQARLYAEDDDAGLRAAHHLDATALAIAKARAAVINQAGNVTALLDAVPQAARRDPGYMFSRIQWLRRNDKVAEAAQWLNAVPRDPAQLIDVDQWWVERRLVSRKLLDLGDARLAYEVANGAAPPDNENYRAEQQFTAGWIALRFLRQPAIALAHFARIADGVSNPITLARSFYWQGRAAEALGRQQDARALYEVAAHYPTAYYGQLARARLGLDEVTPRALPGAPAEHRTLEIARAFEILYAVDQHDLVATMAADLGGKATDAGALAALGEIAARHNDARATLLIGKACSAAVFLSSPMRFPNSACRATSRSAPRSSLAWSIPSCAKKRFQPPRRSSANALGLMQVTPAAGRDTAKRFNVASISAGLSTTSSITRNSVPQSSAMTWRVGAAPTFSLRRLQCGAAPGEGMDRAIWRSARSPCRPDRLDRAYPDLRDAQLRAARDREYAGLPRAARKQSETLDRSRPAPRRLAPLLQFAG